MTTPFADPSAPGGDKLPLPELNNALLVIEVTEALRNVSTAYGDSDPVRCTVHAVDGVHANKTFDDTLIFPKVLASQLRDKVGQVVVGRLGQGVAKPGQSAPWTLNSVTAADKEAAAAAYQRLTQPQISEL